MTKEQVEIMIDRMKDRIIQLSRSAEISAKFSDTERVSYIINRMHSCAIALKRLERYDKIQGQGNSID